VIAEADFEQDTITLKMQCSDYEVRAGQHWLHTTQPAALAAPADTDLMACWVEKPDGTIDGIASMRLALSKYGTAAQPAQPSQKAIEWPNARDVGRYGDMSPSAHLRVGLDTDNDVYLSVWDDSGGASIEFCTPGAGGGASPATRMALIALMLAIEQDNAQRPDKDWWAKRKASHERAIEAAHNITEKASHDQALQMQGECARIAELVQNNPQ
jgi:hypothetical protein